MNSYYKEPRSDTEGNIWYGMERPNKKLMNDNDIWINTDETTYIVNENDYTIYLENIEPLNAILNDLWLGGE